MINAAAIGAITSAFGIFGYEPALTNVRFQGNNGHDADVARCLLMTRSGHGPTPKTASGVPEPSACFDSVLARRELAVGAPDAALAPHRIIC